MWLQYLLLCILYTFIAIKMKGTKVLTLSASNLERMTLRLSIYNNAALAAVFLCLNVLL